MSGWFGACEKCGARPRFLAYMPGVKRRIKLCVACYAAARPKRRRPLL